MLNFIYFLFLKSILSKQIPNFEGRDVSDDMPDDKLCDHPTIKITHEKSFIGRRCITGHEDIQGPLAVCGRYAISLSMTRSIGDRFVLCFVL